MDTILLTKSSAKTFSEELAQTSIQFDEALKLYYRNNEDLKLVKKLLQLSCPLKSCKEILSNRDLLKEHVKVAHDMALCEVCFEHKKVFSSELQVFTKASLSKHERFGDSTFKGHPKCGFCQTLFYSKDELFDHCRQAHELCHICEQQGRRNQYYRNYHHLEDHFNNDHYLCPEKTCLDKKFVVFSTEMDYKSHMAEFHYSKLKGVQRSFQRNLRKVDANFLFETPVGRNNPRPPPPTSSSYSEPRTQAQTPPQPAQPSMEEVMSKLQIENKARFDALIEKLSMTTGKDNLDLTKEILNKYQISSNSSPKEVISSISQLNGIKKTLKIIPIFIELCNDAVKKETLFKEFQDYKVMAKEFPELKPTKMTENISTAPSAARVLVIKNGPVVRKGKSKMPIKSIPQSKQESDDDIDLDFPSLGTLSSSSTSKTKSYIPHSLYRDIVSPFSRVEKVLNESQKNNNPYANHEYFKQKEEEFPSLPNSKPKASSIDSETIREWQDPYAGAIDDDYDSFVIGSNQQTSSQEPSTKGKKKNKTVLIKFGGK